MIPALCKKAFQATGIHPLNKEGSAAAATTAATAAAAAITAAATIAKVTTATSTTATAMDEPVPLDMLMDGSVISSPLTGISPGKSLSTQNRYSSWT